MGKEKHLHFWGPWAWLCCGGVEGAWLWCWGRLWALLSDADSLCHLPVVALPLLHEGDILNTTCVSLAGARSWSSDSKIWYPLWGILGACRRGPIRSWLVQGAGEKVVYWLQQPQGSELALHIWCVAAALSPTGWLPVARAAKPSLDLLIRWCHESGPVCLHWPWCLSKLISGKNQSARAVGARSHSPLQDAHPCVWAHLRKNTGLCKWSLELVWELLRLCVCGQYHVRATNIR